MNYVKLDDRVFGIESRNAYFIMKSFPYAAVKVDEINNLTELKEFYDENIKGSDIFSDSDDYDYKGFFAMEWIMTSDCNLNCPHCFAHKKGEKGRYGLGEKVSLTYEELENGINYALNSFEKDIIKNELTNAEFQLFIIGGEPLIEFENMKKAINYLRNRLDVIKQKNGMESIIENYFLATNGLLISNEIADYLSENPFTVSVSIDTPVNPIKLDNNLTRKTEIAITGVKKLLERNMKKVIINCVIPAEKVYQLDSIMQHIESFGFMDKISGVQISPLTPPTRQAAFSGCDNNEVVVSNWSEDLDRCRFFAQKLKEYCKKYNTDMKKYHFRVSNMLQQGGMAYRCPVGQWKWCLVPGGDIYPCHQFVGLKNYQMGNVIKESDEFYQANESINKMFKERLVFEVEPCSNCPLQACCVVFIDCPGRALLEGGSMYKIPEHQCLMAKDYLLSILEEALWGEL